jgi:hypothetical protein
LTIWKGRLSFKQYIPLKSLKFSNKSYELCESSSGYLWSFIIYIGKDTRFHQRIKVKQQLLCSLVEPLPGKGHKLWMDNFYSAPVLAIRLKFIKTHCAGTLCLNGKYVPKIMKRRN